VPNETDGLIERAAAQLRQSAAFPNASGERLRSQDQDRRSGHAESQVRFGHSVQRAALEADTRPIPAAGVVEHEEWRLRHLLRMASLHKFALTATALLCFAVSAAAILLITPRYTAVAFVAIGNRAPSVATRIQNDVDGTIVQVAPDEAAVNTEVDYLQSRPVAERAMNYLNLWGLPEFNPSVPPGGGPLNPVVAWVRQAIALARQWHARLSGSPVSDLREGELEKRSKAIDNFLAKLTVDVKRSSQIISVQFEDPDPRLAAAAANAVADQYIERQIDLASRAAQRATAGLEQAVAALRERVAQSDQAYESYRGAFDSQNGRELLGKETEEASKELATARVARQVVEARLTALQGLTGANPTNDATSEVTQSRVMQTLHEQAAVLQGRLAELSASFGDANPQVRQVKAAIGTVHREMRAEVARQTRALQADLKVAVAREASLRQGLAGTRAQSAQSSLGQAKLDALKVEAESNRAVLTAFLTRLHEANTSAKLVQRANAEIVAPASVPLRPAFPKTVPFLVMAAVGSTLAGLGVAIAREKAAPTYRSSAEIEVGTGVRTLALVPLIRNLQPLSAEAMLSSASFYVEAVRALYVKLLLRQRLKMFVVTSARPGDGKTTLAASLALLAARAGRKVLLVDADLCTAGASRIFRLEGHAGLAELIGGGKEFADVVATTGDNPNFHFLAAGAAGNLLAARADLEAALGLLRRVRENYDLIVIDSPPVLAVADALALSAAADATLFAVRWGSTPRAAVKLGLDALHASPSGASVGVVLTIVDAHEHARFGYADSAFYAKDLVRDYGASEGRA
jgi:capsular exopolysaccharide synthesis family protein